MNKIIILMVMVFLIQFSLISQEFTVTLEVNSDNIIDSKSKPIKVKGYPIQINISMAGLDKNDKVKYYLHLFQQEQGNSEYYYQSSVLFNNSDFEMLQVYLGAKKDVGKIYIIYAVVNTEKEYRKDLTGIYKVKELPDSSLAKIIVNRP